MNKIIVYKQNNNGIVILFPMPEYLENHSIEELALKDVPENTPYKIINESELPQDWRFRNAWELTDEDKVIVNLYKAKESAHQIRRELREQELKPFDEIIAKQIPHKDFVNPEAERQRIRAKYAELQDKIDSAKNVDDLVELLA